ncbi:uncharacterized protein LOC128221106 [Mya arenaria]|uniref:uncharacterized protein LOC128221106 n=1 Tax=Mya arenaria TaxID=6604 RepID=UPI0022E7C417|nr:uncharacterized protein LOC128221106 [Mya arenaria]
MSGEEETCLDSANTQRAQAFILNQLNEHHPFSSRVRPDATPTPSCNGFAPHMGTTSAGSSSQQATQSNFPFSNITENGGNSIENVETFFMRVLTRVNATIEMNEKRIAEQDYRERIKLEWQHVARIIDRILLTIFVAVTLTTTCAVMFQAGD